MRQRIIVVLGMAVALLTLYTVAFRAHPVSVAQDLRYSVATEVSGKAKAAPAATATEPAPAAAPARESAQVNLATNVVPPEVWGSDPFVRDWIMVNEVANLDLKAITTGNGLAYALINDQILQEGDEISGKRIVKIETDKVTLEQGGRTFTLLLGE